MKKFLFSFLTVLMGLSVAGCTEVIKNPDQIPVNYLTIDDVVNSAEFLPPPPDSTSALWLVDVEQYRRGKALRATERGRQALRDAFVHADSLPQAFSEAFGHVISPEATPATFRLITHMREDAGDLATRHAKQHYQRPRPFMVFGEPTPLPEQEAELRTNGSYPSGHSAIGYAVALVLAEVNPARAQEIMQRGFDIGESRVILGFHFDSDVRAGRQCASMVVPLLHANPEFLRDLSAAKREIQLLTAE